jgi:hypothetical protein
VTEARTKPLASPQSTGPRATPSPNPGSTFLPQFSSTPTQNTLESIPNHSQSPSDSSPAALTRHSSLTLRAQAWHTDVAMIAMIRYYGCNSAAIVTLEICFQCRLHLTMHHAVLPITAKIPLFLETVCDHKVPPTDAALSSAVHKRSAPPYSATYVSFPSRSQASCLVEVGGCSVRQCAV